MKTTTVTTALNKSRAKHPAETVHTYIRGETTVILRIDRLQRVHVSATTLRLRLETISQTALQALRDLYKDRDVMMLCGDSGPKPFDYAEKRLKRWTEQAQNGDPYHGLVVSKLSNNITIGFTALGHSEEPGIAELVRMLFKGYWNQGFGTEIANAIAENIAPTLRGAGYRLRGQPIETIRAAVNPINERAQRSLLKAGFDKKIEKKRHENNKAIYFYSVEHDIPLVTEVVNCEKISDE